MGVAGELQLGGSSGGPHKVVGGAGVGGLECGGREILWARDGREV